LLISHAASIPNITGSVPLSYGTPSGAFEITGSTSSRFGVYGTAFYFVTSSINARLCSTVYSDDATTITVDSLKVQFYIKA